MNFATLPNSNCETQALQYTVSLITLSCQSAGIYVMYGKHLSLCQSCMETLGNGNYFFLIIFCVCGVKQQFIYVMIPWVGNLGQAQLGGFSADACWAHPCIWLARQLFFWRLKLICCWSNGGNRATFHPPTDYLRLFHAVEKFLEQLVKKSWEWQLLLSILTSHVTIRPAGIFFFFYM